MSTSKSIKTTCSVLGYTYPKLYTASEWYVAFWALDPATSEPKRKRFMLDHIANKRKRKDYAEELIFSLVTKLKSGWNPWMEQIDSRAYTLFSDCVSKYGKFRTDGALQSSHPRIPGLSPFALRYRPLRGSQIPRGLQNGDTLEPGEIDGW